MGRALVSDVPFCRSWSAFMSRFPIIIRFILFTNRLIVTFLLTLGALRTPTDRPPGNDRQPGLDDTVGAQLHILPQRAFSAGSNLRATGQVLLPEPVHHRDGLQSRHQIAPRSLAACC